MNTCHHYLIIFPISSGFLIASLNERDKCAIFLFGVLLIQISLLPLQSQFDKAMATSADKQRKWG